MSRWDALKPSNDRGKGGNNINKRYSRDTVGNNRPIEQNPPRNWNNGNFGGRTRSRADLERKPNNSPRESDDTGISIYRKAVSPKTNSVRNKRGSNANEDGGRNSKEWDKLVSVLCHFAQEQSSKKSQEELREVSAENSEEILTLLEQLSALLEDTPKLSVHSDHITASQRGNALAAVYDVLSSADDSAFIISNLEWIRNLMRQSVNPDSIRITNEQAQKCIDSLLQMHNLFRDDSNADNRFQHLYLECLLDFLRSFAGLLPAEQTGHLVVDGLLLPGLEYSLPCRKEGHEQEGLIFLRALHSLLKVKKHASAVLTPLVNNVATDGREQYLINPLRKRLFSVLQLGLQTSSQSTMFAETVCQCLTTALQMALLVDKSTALIESPNNYEALVNPYQPVDLDTAVIGNILRDTFAEDIMLFMDSGQRNYDSKRSQILQMLLAFLRKYPDASMSLGKMLLFNMDSRCPSAPIKGKKVCSSCNCDAALLPPFLGLLHLTRDVGESASFMECLKLLIHDIPWNLWMGNKKQPQVQRYRMLGSTFFQRVSNAILNIIEVAACQLNSMLHTPVKSNAVNRNFTDSISKLVYSVLLEMPYNYGGAPDGDSVLNAAVGLFETVASKCLVSNQPLLPFRDVMADVFVECMGGRETPQGVMTKMIIPAHVWLSSASSQTFLDGLFWYMTRSALTGEVGASKSFAKVEVKLLCSILRARAQIILGSEKNWKQLWSIVNGFCSKESKHFQLSALQLVECLLRGRQGAGNATLGMQDKVAMVSILSLLPRMTGSPHGTCRIVCFQAYGNVLGSDWLEEAGGRSVDLKFHVDLILSHCLKENKRTDSSIEMSGEIVAGVREAACKAIADICNNIFLVAEQDCNDVYKLRRGQEGCLLMISHDVCATLTDAMRNGNASVRSMALFGMGNLAQALCSEAYPCPLNPGTLRNACLLVFESLDDASDKTSSNAIRSIGHFVGVILRNEYSNPFEDIGWDQELFCQRVMISLANKVSSLVTNMSKGTEKSLSWKQRTGTKKHARVACNSFAIIFAQLSARRELKEQMLGTCQAVFCSIGECIGLLGSSLDEKVLIAAIQAFRASNSSFLAIVSGKTGIIGNAMVSCILYIAEKDWSNNLKKPNSKLFVKVELLLEHLLESASIHDATIVITCDDIEGVWMNQLYDWMLLRQCPARAFDTFAIALQNPALHIPMSVEQRFTNRAMNLLRHAQLPTTERTDAEAAQTEHTFDAEDEL